MRENRITDGRMPEMEPRMKCYMNLDDLSVGDYVVFCRDGEEEKARVHEISYYSGVPTVVLDTASRRFVLGCQLIVSNVRKAE
jgi:hypothetical protein